MAFEYVYSGQQVADGERVFFLSGDKKFIRTGVVNVSLDGTEQFVTYRLREVRETTEISEPPAGGSINAHYGD